MKHFDMELTQRQVKKYQRASKKQKGEIITRYCELTGVSRNLASKRFRKVIRDIHPRVLKDKSPKKKSSSARKPGRKRTYIGIHWTIVRKAWELSGEICAERLHPVIGSYIQQLEKNGDFKYYGKRYIQETKDISEATLRRIICRFPQAGKRRAAKGNAAIYKAVPIQAHFGKNAHKSGYVEIDYVEHNGGNSSGVFANTGSYADVGLGWIARSAGLGKGLRAVTKIHDMNEDKIHHLIYEYHPDNARPILKLLLEKTLGEKPMSYTISRSRPYHKEDNGHVEQKNGDKVRKLVGYHRYDTEEQVRLLNKLYNIEDLISNFFLPSQKLIEKIKDERGRVIRRKHDQAQTSYQRLMTATDIDEKVKEKVSKLYNRLNLIRLRKASETLQEQLLQTVVSRK